MRYCIQPGGTGGPVTPLVRCPQFEQRLLRFNGDGEERRDDARDEVLYVLEGSADAAIGVATAGREFSLLAQPENGCASVTQFVGYIPTGRAPDHFHRYDEVVYILEGEGGFHVDGVTEPLEPGTAVHLPARLVHCLENYGPGEMRVLGVFRPAGSPAEAYYPDGTPAAVPVA